MPDPHDNAKMTGDTHPPDVESELPLEGEAPDSTPGGTARDRGKAMERGAQGRPGRGSRKGGVLKDQDDETGDSHRNTRDSGESPDENRG